MSTTRNNDQTNIICGLKAAVTALECHHNMQTSKKRRKKIECKATSPAIHIIVYDKIQEKKKLRNKPICNMPIPLKSIHCLSMGIESRKEKRVADRREKTSRLIFPEMRGGILYSRCCCLHRDGLQDYCPLSQCQGQAKCLVKPWAICPPGKFVRLRHPELYPNSSNTSCVT